MSDPAQEHVDNFLAHYGVKGMKWGVRRSDAQLSAAAKKRSSKVQGKAGLTAQTTVRALAISGASSASGIVGGSLGTMVLGPGLGTMVGGYVGSLVGATSATKAVTKKQRAADAAAKADIQKFLPDKNPNYTDNMVKRDINLGGAESAKRINKSMNEGLSRREANQKESSLRFQASMMATGASMVTAGLGTYAAMNASSIKQTAYKKAFEAGAARNQRKQAAANSTKIGAESALKFAKKKRGVYNVSSL